MHSAPLLKQKNTVLAVSDLNNWKFRSISAATLTQDSRAASKPAALRPHKTQLKQTNQNLDPVEKSDKDWNKEVMGGYLIASELRSIKWITSTCQRSTFSHSVLAKGIL